MNAIVHFAKRLKGIHIFSIAEKIQAKNLNLCGSCSSWNFSYDKSKTQHRHLSAFDNKTGFCFGVGGDVPLTQSDDSCSNWVPAF